MTWRYGFLAILLLALPSSAGATPQLQLFLDPSLNPGAFYDPVEKDWVTPGNGSVTVSLFMQGQLPTDTYKLIVSTPNFDPIAEGVGVPPITSVSGAVLGATSGWLSGTPACCGGSMPLHSEFPDEYASYELSFTGPTTTVFDVQTTTFNPDGSINTLAGAKTGYRADLVMTFADDGDFKYHLDLINMTATGVPNGKQKAPFSHDASVLVPEPSAAFVFGVGSLLVGWRLRRRSR